MALSAALVAAAGGPPAAPPGRRELPHVVESARGVPLGLPPSLKEGLAAVEQRQHFELGRDLFFDPILSLDRSVSCASCHDPRHGYASREPFPPGAAGARAARNAPTLLNRALGRAQMWDGRAPSLVAQVLQPISNPREMRLPLAEALERLRADRGYRARFASLRGVSDERAAAGSPVTEAALARCLTAFVGSLLIGDSPVDRFRSALESTLTESEKAGLWIYESKARCWRCHSGANFTDESFHNTGVGAKDGRPEAGRFAVTGDDADRGRFKTPTLRGVALTAPYMHDGSIATLEEVVEFYRQGGRPNSHLDEQLKPLDLSDDDARDIVAFLRALSRVEAGPSRPGQAYSPRPGGAPPGGG